MDVKKIQQQLLAAKDETYLRKLQIIQTFKLPIIALAINVPGYPKSNKLIEKFFYKILEEFRVYALAHRILLHAKSELIIDNEGGLSFIASFSHPTSPNEAKKLTENFEVTHSLGRFLDVDIIDLNKEPVSSKKEKNCFYCKQFSAIHCMRNKTHTIKELRDFQHEKISEYLINKHRANQSEILSEILFYALLAEISLDPKPGLVSPTDNGSHSDMDYQTFLQSTAALSNVFTKLFQHILIEKNDFSFEELRAIGIEAERKMLVSTSQINTHKGAIFLMIILGYSIAKILSDNQLINDENIKTKLLNFSNYVEKDPLNHLDDSHGNQVRQALLNDEVGIKAELKNGLPTLFSEGILPLRNNQFSLSDTSKTKKKTLTLSLLQIMSKNNDTNILYRGNATSLKDVKKRSLNAIKNIENDNWQPYYNFCNWMKEKNLSPGGSADILASSIFVYLCQINPKLKPYEF